MVGGSPSSITLLHYQTDAQLNKIRLPLRLCCLREVLSYYLAGYETKLRGRFDFTKNYFKKLNFHVIMSIH